MRSVTITMVEDDEGHARLIEKNIRAAGITNVILCFVDCASALRHLLGPDGSGRNSAGLALLILLDLNLPDMDGIEIPRQFKQNQHLKRPPVVILSTTDNERENQRCYQLGCNVYIAKPADYTRFANAMRQLGLFFSVMQAPEAP